METSRRNGVLGRRCVRTLGACIRSYRQEEGIIQRIRYDRLPDDGYPSESSSDSSSSSLDLPSESCTSLRGHPEVVPFDLSIVGAFASFSTPRL